MRQRRVDSTSLVSMSLRCACGSCPLSLAEGTRPIVAAAHSLPRKLPENSQFCRPSAMGRMRFSTQLLSLGSSPSSMKRPDDVQGFKR